jgi:hypothetical protein
MKGAYHQLLTDDVGHPALAQHLHAVVTLMRVSKNWTQFKGMLDIAHPKRGDTFDAVTEKGEESELLKLARKAYLTPSSPKGATLNSKRDH